MTTRSGKTVKEYFREMPPYGCPSCYWPYASCLETVMGVANGHFGPTGDFEYSGYTDILWDTQEFAHYECESCNETYKTPVKLTWKQRMAAARKAKQVGW